jgi:hypothetical protein
VWPKYTGMKAWWSATVVRGKVTTTGVGIELLHCTYVMYQKQPFSGYCPGLGVKVHHNNNKRL